MKNTFYDKDEDLELSQIGRYFCGGVMEHARGLTAIYKSYHKLLSQIGSRV